MFLAALDQTVVLTTLPEMLRDVHVELAELDRASWIITGYLLGYVSVLPLMGRLADVYGRRRLFLAALAVFGGGSVACATARTLGWLVAARVCQAVGGGALLPIACARAADELEERRRPVWLGIIGAAAEAGGVVGPLYGALIVQHVGWRWIFWLNLPLVLLAGWAVMATAAGRPADGARVEQVDYAGAALFALALTALTAGLSGSADPTGSRSPIPLERALPLALVAAVAGVGFAWRQRSALTPLMPPGLWRDRRFAVANAVNALVGVALIAAMVDVPLFAATVLGRSPLNAGLALLRMTAFIPVGALAGGWLAPRLRTEMVPAAGLGLAAAGFAFMGQWTLEVSDAAMTPGLVLAGLGFGLVIAPITNVVLTAVGEQQRALSTSLLTVMRMSGMTVGLAALTSIGFYRFNQLVAGLRLPGPGPGAGPEALASRMAAYEAALTRAALEVFTGIFLLAAGICAFNCLLALALRDGSPAPRRATPDGGSV